MNRVVNSNIMSRNGPVRHFSHVPVLADEIVNLFRPDHGKVYIDMTFGAGGHTKRLLDTNKNIKVVAVDRDPVAYQRAKELAAEIAIKSDRLNIKQCVIPVHGKYSQVIQQIHLSGIPYNSVNGVLFDLGASSMQYDNPERGFSLSANGPLDMRMDPSVQSDITAEDVVNTMNMVDLATILRDLGGERKSRKIANAIIDARTLLGRIRTTGELSRVIASARSGATDLLGRFAHPGTKTFQALRIFVNNELNEFNFALHKIRDFLIPTSIPKDYKFDGGLVPEVCGIAAVISFHSLEDSIAKRHFTGIDKNQPSAKRISQHDRIRTNVATNKEEVEEVINYKLWSPVWSHVIKPSENEMENNPRSRSARLRAAICLETDTHY